MKLSQRCGSNTNLITASIAKRYSCYREHYLPCQFIMLRPVGFVSHVMKSLRSLSAVLRQMQSTRAQVHAAKLWCKPIFRPWRYQIIYNKCSPPRNGRFTTKMKRSINASKIWMNKHLQVPFTLSQLIFCLQCAHRQKCKEMNQQTVTFAPSNGPTDMEASSSLTQNFSLATPKGNWSGVIKCNTARWPHTYAMTLNYNCKIIEHMCPMTLNNSQKVSKIRPK